MTLKFKNGLLPAGLLVLLLFPSGCGYSLHRHAALPFTEIGIGLIENRTLEPKLQDRLFRALALEFERQGIRVDQAAPLKLTGAINAFSMVALSEKGGVTREYRITASADFRLTGGDGKVRDIKGVGTPFFISFTGSDELGQLIAAREAAEERAMADMAVQLVHSLIHP